MFLSIISIVQLKRSWSNSDFIFTSYYYLAVTENHAKISTKKIFTNLSEYNFLGRYKLKYRFFFNGWQIFIIVNVEYSQIFLSKIVKTRKFKVIIIHLWIWITSIFFEKITLTMKKLLGKSDFTHLFLYDFNF